MGCDVHLVTEIFKDGNWKYVEEYPVTLTKRNYSVFSVLANVRNSFKINCFQPKGYPDDISGKKFRFKSDTPYYKKKYETESAECIDVGDGKYHMIYDSNDSIVKKSKIEITELEYNYIKENSDSSSTRYRGLCYSSNNNDIHYYVTDADFVNGKIIKVKYKDIYKDYDSFIKDENPDDWDVYAKDYGYWDIDFDSVDYHSASFLSLAELDTFSLSDYLMEKVKIPKVFYDEFIKRGGQLPDGMTLVSNDVEGNDFISIIQQAFCPDVIIGWNDAENKNNDLDLIKGINELKEIAAKYKIDNYNDIRIVFAFDN